MTFPPDNQDVYDGVSFVEFPDDPKDMAAFLNFFYELLYAKFIDLLSPLFTATLVPVDGQFAFNMSGV